MNNISSDTKKWLALIGISIVNFIGCIDFTIVNTALPAIQADFKVNIETLQWIINIFILALSSFMVVMGNIADIYGRRRLLYIGIASFAMSSLFAGYSSSITHLIFWRLIQGISCAIFYTTSGAIISNIFPAEKLGKAMGIFFGISFTGLAAGPVMGGIIVGVLNWRWIFFVNIPVILISFIICLFNVPESKNESSQNKVDYLGAALLLIGIVSFILAIIKSNDWGLSNKKTLIILLVSIISFIFLYKVETKATHPIVKFKIFKNKLFLASISATFFLAFFYCLAFFLMPLYLHNIKGESSYMIGIMLLPTTSMVAITSPIIGKIVDKKGPHNSLLWGFILFFISALLQVNFSIYTQYTLIILAFILMGIGWGSIVGPATILSLHSLPKTNGALAIGTSWTMHNIGGVLGLSIGTAIFNLQLEKHHNSFIYGYHSAMMLLVVSSLGSWLILKLCFKK